VITLALAAENQRGETTAAGTADVVLVRGG